MAGTFDDWRIAFSAAATDDHRAAQLMILDREARIPEALGAFRDMLAASFEDLVARVPDPGAAAIEALDAVVRRITPHASTMCFQLPVAPGRAVDAASTHVTLRGLARLGMVADLDEFDPDPQPRIEARGDEVSGPEKIATWITPDDCGDDPVGVALTLGLPHFAQTIAYRFALDVAHLDQYVPSCLDAGLYAAWQEPPAGHTGPGGLTRHVEDGSRLRNELLVRSRDLADVDLVLERLPRSGPAVRIRTLVPDYVSNR